MKQRTALQLCAKLIGLVKPLSGWMLLAVTLGLAGHLCAAFITIEGAAALLNQVSGTAALGTGLFGLIAGMAFLRGILRYGEQACNHYIAFRLLALIRTRVFQALRRLAPAKLEGRDKGNLIQLITSDIELLEVFYAHTLSPVLIALLMTAFMTVWIGRLHPLLGLTALMAYLTVGIAIPAGIHRRSQGLGPQLRQQSGELSSMVLETLRGLPEILQYGTGSKRLKELDQRTGALAENEQKMKVLSGKNTALTQTIVLFFDVVMLTTAGLLTLRGQLDFGSALLAVVGLMSSFGPVIALANLGSTLQNTFAAGSRVLDLLEETPVVTEITGRPQVGFTGVQAEHLRFSYGEDEILTDLSLAIAPGRITGITGRSGSGKSTFLKLLMRFWDVQEGKLTLSATPVNQINTANLRQLESYVTQDTHLFHDTIANNLRIAKPDATAEEIQEACRKASIHDWILTLPQGYDTPVGELGDTLSGGEEQRLGLARAFLHSAPLILLDEPTSNLDSLNEAVILRSLRQEKEDRTIVLVSHRKSTMRIADQVAVVEQGRCS
ncbi:amino acid ABC transporter ATP-binding/permease protein [Holdemania filiformis]|uniref:amino acid ABC transporter ATP-binding/permease protein n=2 Tax=Holdemania filiformis TaxID=61171 RepID=UPI002675FBB8|nr:ABC transporter ATP-binding protein [Holdemania filiformis]